MGMRGGGGWVGGGGRSDSGRVVVMTVRSSGWL